MWFEFLTAQAIGSVCAVGILSGWGIVGEAAIAGPYRSGSDRVQYYRASVRSRLRLSAVVIPTALLVLTVFLRRLPSFEATLMLTSAALAGLTLSWYAIGIGRAAWIARYEVVPRAVATVASAPALWLTRQPWIYPALLIASTVLGLVGFARCEHHRRRDAVTHIQALDVSERRNAAGLNLAGNIYGSALLPVAALVGGVGGAGLASADRLFRYSLFSVTSLANALQSWVVGSEPMDLRRRQQLAIRIHVGLGLVGCFGLTFASYPVGRVLFGENVAPDAWASVGYGLAFLFVSVSTPLIRNVLVPAKETRIVLRATLVSGMLGVPAMLAGGYNLGLGSIPFGLALSEAVTLLSILPRARLVLQK